MITEPVIMQTRTASRARYLLTLDMSLPHPSSSCDGHRPDGPAVAPILREAAIRRLIRGSYSHRPADDLGAPCWPPGGSHDASGGAWSGRHRARRATP